MMDALQVSYDQARRLVLSALLDSESLAGDGGQLDSASHGVLMEMQLPPEAYKSAVKEARSLKASGCPTYMHYVAGSRSVFGHLRSLLLDCVRPGADGRLQGYAPSNCCALTIAKGWSGGVRFGRLAAQEPLIALKLCDVSLLGLVLGRLDGCAMAYAMVVNRDWDCSVRSSPGFALKAKRFRELASRDGFDYSGGNGGRVNHGGAQDDSDHHDIYATGGGGYGSGYYSESH